MGFLNENGLKSLLTDIMNGVNTRISERIVNTISEDSDDNHTPSAKAVYNLVKSMTSAQGSVFEYVTGPITDVTEPQTNIIYLQRDSEADKVYTQYMYIGDEFIPIGSTELSDERVSEIFNEVFTDTAPDLTNTAPEDQVTDPEEGE